MTISTSGEDADSSVLPDATGPSRSAGVSRNTTPLVTKSGALALTSDILLITIGMIVAAEAGLIRDSAVSLNALLLMQLVGICGSLMLSGWYRHPAAANVRINLVLSVCAAALAAMIAVPPALLPVLNDPALGWDGPQGAVLQAGLVWVLLFAGHTLFEKGLRWRYRHLVLPGVLLVHDAGAGGANRGEVADLARRLGGCAIVDSAAFMREGGAETDRYTDIVFAGPWSSSASFRLAVSRASEMAVNVYTPIGDPASRASGRDLPQESRLIRGVPVATLAHRPLSPSWEAVKRAFDVIASLALIAFLLPAFALIAAAIRLDSRGPILFRQARHGYNNKPFQILKFRSMRPVTRAVGEEVTQATRNDMRVTRVGRILRRLSLDELPQIFNVLKGDMSLVGPRPHALAHHRQYCSLIDGYSLRHRVRPGITGWAQIHGFRGETDTLDKMASRVAYDLDYIERWSLALDIRILLATAAVGFVHENAY
jgi:exopolysaccharide biosynthesis polyprenyl glycosylphosphotransferase